MNTRNKAILITGIIVAGIGIALFLIGGAIAGWDFIAFFKSQTFIWICLLIGLYALAVIGILIKDWLDRL